MMFRLERGKHESGSFSSEHKSLNNKVLNAIKSWGEEQFGMPNWHTINDSLYHIPFQDETKRHNETDSEEEEEAGRNPRKPEIKLIHNASGNPLLPVYEKIPALPILKDLIRAMFTAAYRE
jgi:hypothetical protein